MKILICIPIVLFLNIHLFSQDCDPMDAVFPNETSVVTPGPSLPDSANTGINEPACLDSLYSFTFHIRVPSSLSIGGLTAQLESARLDSVGGLPNGIDFSCSTENCVFDTDTIGCIFLNGIADDEIGDYPLTIFATIQTTTLPLGISFPGPLAPGEYILSVKESCSGITSGYSFIKAHPNIFPNPARSELNIQDFDFDGYRLINMQGRLIKELLNAPTDNTISIEDLQPGIYILELINKHTLYRQHIYKI